MNSAASSNGLPRPTNKRPFNRTRRFWVIILIILIAFIAAKYFTSHFKKDSPQSKAQPVVISTARSGDVPVYLSALGAVTGGWME